MNSNLLEYALLVALAALIAVKVFLPMGEGFNRSLERTGAKMAEVVR